MTSQTPFGPILPAAALSCCRSHRRINTQQPSYSVVVSTCNLRSKSFSLSST